MQGELLTGAIGLLKKHRIICHTQDPLEDLRLSKNGLGVCGHDHLMNPVKLEPDSRGVELSTLPFKYI